MKAPTYWINIYGAGECGSQKTIFLGMRENWWPLIAPPEGHGSLK